MLDHSNGDHNDVFVVVGDGGASVDASHISLNVMYNIIIA